MNSYPLNKLQKKILVALSKEKRGYVSLSKVLELIKESRSDAVLDAFRTLERDEYIKVLKTLGDAFPQQIEITAAGIEKAEETILIRIQKTAYDNPWPVIAIIITLIGLMVGYTITVRIAAYKET